MPVPSPDLDALLALAVEIAEEAGALLLDRIDVVRETVETKSTRTDMVTEVDRASEALIAGRIRARRPDDAILGEEGAAETGTTGVRWIVDPLDGTTNYLYGFPAFAVSIGVEVGGAGAVGVVRDPVRAETFTAVTGRGAHVGRRRLAVSPKAELATALVGTGFGYDPARRAVQAALLPRVLPAVRDIRRAGSAALDLCWVAAGRLDAHYEIGLQPWDRAAGELVVREAGGVVSDLPDGTLVASGPALHQALVTLVSAGPG